MIDLIWWSGGILVTLFSGISHKLTVLVFPTSHQWKFSCTKSYLFQCRCLSCLLNFVKDPQKLLKGPWQVDLRPQGAALLLLSDIQSTRSLYLCLACPWSRSQLFFISCCFIVSLSFMDGFLVERRKDSNSNGWEDIYSGWIYAKCLYSFLSLPFRKSSSF